MSLATRLAAKVVDSLIGAQTLWLEYRATPPAPADGELVGATCDADGNLNVAVAGGITLPNALDVEGTGVAGTPAGGVLSVQGVASGTALNVRGAAANQAAASGNPIPIAGYDSGNSGRTQVPDIDSNGAVRLQSGGASGAAVPSRVTQVGGPDGGGLLRALLMSAAGIAQVSAAKGTSSSSTGLEASRVVSASACLPSRVSMLNTNASVRYLHIFNTASLPSNGAVPIDTAHCTTGQRAIITYSIPTDRCSTGMTVAFSSTSNTLTIGAAEALFTVDLYPSNS
jgi:hypothetical protein